MRKIKYIVKTREQVVKQRIITYSTITAILTILSLLAIKSFKSVQAIEIEEPKAKIEKTNERIRIEENENEINVKEILKENTSQVQKKTLNVDDVDLDYTTEYVENNELPTGTIQVKQEGVDGCQKMIIIKTYIGDEYISEERIPGKILSEASNKIVEIGTGEGQNNYSPKEGDAVWATPGTVSLREYPTRKSSEICVIKRDDKAVIMEVVNSNWLKVQYSTFIGYVDSACFSNVNPHGTTTYALGVEYTKSELMAGLDFNMDLRRPSGLSIDQFKKVLSGNSGDSNNVLASNAEYFYYAERQYGINGVFLASMAIHEGGWGTSAIANDKKNLFGYGAYDSNPYGGATSFSSYSEGIDLVARVLVKSYLNPPGTEIYDGQTATGTYYNGPTLTGVNTRYATDKNWANAVFKWMNYLYDRL